MMPCRGVGLKRGNGDEPFSILQLLRPALARISTSFCKPSVRSAHRPALHICGVKIKYTCKRAKLALRVDRHV